LTASPTELGAVTFTVTFSEQVSGVDNADFSLATTGGQADAAFSANPLCITTTCLFFVTTGSGNGTLGLNLAASPSIQDNVGNGVSVPFTGEVYTVIKSAPVVSSIILAGPNPTNAASIDFTVTFSTDVTGVDTGDFALTTGGGISAGPITGVTPVTGAVYTVSVNTGSGNGTLGLNLVDNDSIHDFANPLPHYLGGLGTGNGNFTGPVYTVDKTAPTIAITSSSTGPTHTSPIPVTITFDEPVTGFVVGGITVGNGTASNFNGSGTTYTADITPAAAGTVTVDVAAGGAVDLAGNGNTAAPQFSIVYDNIAPAVTITSSVSDPTHTSPIPVTFTFSKAVTGFGVGSIMVGNGTAGNFGGSGSIYTADISPAANGTVTVDVAAGVAVDAAGNGNTVAPQLSITYDTVAPTLVITSIESSPTNASPIPVTFTFSKAVTGFDVGEIMVSNGATANFAGSGTSYTVDVTPITNGTVTVNVAAGVATDAAGNGNTAAVPFTITSDNTAIVVITGGVMGNPGVITITDGGTYSNHFTGIQVAFSEDASNLFGGEDHNDVTNPDNYLLLQAGPNGMYDTESCGMYSDGGLLLDDIKIPTGPVIYSNNDGKFVATITVNGGIPLPSGQYLLYICGTSSITDLAGNHLGGGIDTVLNFRISDPATLPATGFAPDRVTALPSTATTYAGLGDLWLEIPRLGVQMPIVGVPEANGSWDVSWLGNSAGWLNGSAFPTHAGNSVLTGHVYNANGQPGPFVHLNQMWYGDKVIVHTGNALYVYEVREVTQVGPKNTAALLKHEELPWITLVTCRGYDESTNSYRFRVLVRAVLVEVK
jgi:LPXTG-site transpeptidase (sortase) family protein